MLFKVWAIWYFGEEAEALYACLFVNITLNAILATRRLAAGALSAVDSLVETHLDLSLLAVWEHLKRKKESIDCLEHKKACFEHFCLFPKTPNCPNFERHFIIGIQYKPFMGQKNTLTFVSLWPHLHKVPASMW